MLERDHHVNGIFQCSSHLEGAIGCPISTSRKSSMQRGTGAICRPADMAARGHVTGYGQLALTELAEASSENSSGTRSEGN